MSTSIESASPPPGYFARLWHALLGRDAAPAAASPHASVAGPSPAPAPVPLPATLLAPSGNEPGLRDRIAALEASLLEAEEKLRRMRAEYAALESDKGRAGAAAGGAELQRVFKRLSAPLALLSALAQKTLAGAPVPAADLAEAVASVEKALAAGGLERIGNAGAAVAYDASVHARMSGGAARDGETVVLQLPGYRYGTVVLHKAMVSIADKPGQGS
jgi:molecular chaperone GrpE (heat shock protein)